MAFLAKNYIFVGGIKSFREMNKLRYILTETRTGIFKNERLLPVTNFRNFVSKNDITSDKKEDKNIEVYRGSLTTQVRSVKVFTILSSVTGLMAQPMLYSKLLELGPSAGIIGFGVFYGFFVLVSPLLIHLLTKRYVTNLEYNPKDETYTAYTYTFFIRKKKIEFTPDDVKIPTVNGMFTTIVVKNKPLFLDPRMFDNPSHYAKIMGYDKPIDFSIDSEDRKK